MSHSKMTKRGRSHYLESWNPKAKQYIVSCGLCGREGFKPCILEADFADSLEHKAIRSELESILSPLKLNPDGHCAECGDRIKEDTQQGTGG